MMMMKFDSDRVSCGDRSVVTVLFAASVSSEYIAGDYSDAFYDQRVTKAIRKAKFVITNL